MNITVTGKLIYDGKTHYAVTIDGIPYTLNADETLQRISQATETNAVVVANKYVRLKSGKLPTQEHSSLIINRNGLDYFNPQIGIIIDVAKIRGYALNKNHDVGKNKARVFESVLGYTKTDYKIFIEEIRNKIFESPIVGYTATQYGVKYRVDMVLQGKKGNAVACSGWMECGKHAVRLLSIYVKG